MSFCNAAVQISLATQFGTLFDNGVMYVFSGARPASPRYPVSMANMIGYISHNGDAFVSGVATNGLVWGTPVISADESHVELPFDAACTPMLFCSLASGQSAVAGFARLYPNTVDDNLEDTDETRPRVDFPAAAVLDSLTGGMGSSTTSIRFNGQTKSSFNTRLMRFPFYSGQVLTV